MNMYKKTFTSLLLIISIMVSQMLFCVSVTAQDSSTPNVRFGVISDVHLSDDTSKVYKEEVNLVKALTKFKEENIKALMVVGDTADAGKKGSYDKFNNIFNQVFDDPATRPQKIVTMGNHDYYGNLFPSIARSEFKTAFGADVNRSIVINGYSFISISTYDNTRYGNYPTSSLNWLKQQIDNAIASNPNNPVFVFSHHPPMNTNYLSSDWGSSELRNTLNSYPQVVLFSGHTHCPLEDERSISQKDFTVVGTATLSYTELETGKVNGPVPPRAGEVAQGLIVDVTNSNVLIKKWDFNNDEQIKNDWIIDLPISKSNFRYNETRENSIVAPQFDIDSSITISEVTQSSATFTVPKANHSDFVQSYRVKVINASTNAVVLNNLWFSDFYLGIQRMSPTQTFSVSNLASNNMYKVEITAIESFGKESIPLVANFTTATPMVIVDDLNDWSKTFSHTSGWWFDSSNTKYFNGDTSRASRNSGNDESIVYNYENITDLVATVYEYKYYNNISFYSSPDNQTWTQLGYSSVERVSTGGSWTRNVYKVNNIPHGTKYLKITHGDNSDWQKQISKVKITYVSP